MQHQGEGPQQPRLAATEHAGLAAAEAGGGQRLAHLHAQVAHLTRRAHIRPRQATCAVGLEDIAHRQDSWLKKPAGAGDRKRAAGPREGRSRAVGHGGNDWFGRLSHKVIFNDFVITLRNINF